MSDVENLKMAKICHLTLTVDFEDQGKHIFK